MNLSKVLSGAIDTAFSVANEATVAVALFSNPNSSKTYDPTTGKFIGGTATAINVTGIKYQSKDQKLAEDSAKTATVLIRVSELAAQGYTGDLTDADTLIIEGITWSVQRADRDPVGVVWTVQLTK